MTDIRLANRERPVLAVKHKSPISCSGCSARCFSYLSTRLCNAASLLADSARMCSALSVSRSFPDPGNPLPDTFSGRIPDLYSDASSSTMWALVPLNPKELTPAIRPSGGIHDRPSAATSIDISFQSIWGFGILKCRWGGISLC